MKQQSILISSYAMLLLIGGFVGYYVAGSAASIIMSGAFALILQACSIFIRKGYEKSYHIAMSVVLCLFFFFSYRFFISFKFAPAGIMMLVTAALLISLTKEKLLNFLRKGQS